MSIKNINNEKKINAHIWFYLYNTSQNHLTIFIYLFFRHAIHKSKIVVAAKKIVRCKASVHKVQIKEKKSYK